MDPVATLAATQWYIPMLMQIRYQFTAKDMIEAHWGRKNPLFRFLVYFGAVAIVLGIVLLVENPQGTMDGVRLILLGLIFSSAMNLQILLSFKRNPMYKMPLEANISDGGIEISRANARTNYQWDAFTRYRETRRLFLLFQTGNIYVVFPKRAFAPDEVESFRRLAEQHLPPPQRAK